MIFSKNNLMSIYNKYMVAVGIFGQFLFYVQAYEIMKYHKTEGISITGFSIAIFSLTNWLIYGIIIKDKVVIIANIAGVLGALAVLVSLFIYG